VRHETGPEAPKPAGSAEAFKTVLEGKLRFSAHAADRLQQRKAKLGRSEMKRISAGLAKAESKGGRESLLLLGDLALIVNVPSRTVITALSGSRMKEAVFTNIDSAVVV